ncbi:SEC-C metal-binding domain-containing protein [Clostridium perfringens]|uniref:YecA family protein n=1 Tax=Clostridium perfringens TaxID=1502 RepID=UPI003F43BD11
MNCNTYQKCSVCGTITRIRIQAGHLEKHPIRYNCGKYGILINGIYSQNEKEFKLNVKFDNAEAVSETNAEYYIESSGEFISEKLSKNDVMPKISPFIYSYIIMGEDIEKFAQNTGKFFFETKPNWHRYRRIFELYQNENDEFLQKEVHNLLSKEQYPCDNELEKLRAIHFLIYRNFQILHKNNFLEETMSKIGQLLCNCGREQISLLVKYFKDNNNMLLRYREKIFNMLTEFTEIFQYLIPAYGVECFSKVDIDYKINGMTTCSFEDIKQFYLDAYEVIGEIILLPIALDNILYRGDFKSLNDDFYKSSKIKDLTNLKDATKGTKYKYINLEEEFCKIADVVVNSKLRNAIGHNDYMFDGINQKIIYIPNSARPEKKEEIYLLEFAIECIKLMKAIIIIEEIIYRVQQLQLIGEGHVPTVKISSYIKKVGRNEPCPCGSGKKFKKCHGANK